VWIATYNSGARDIATWGQYVLASLYDGRIVAVDRSTGAPAWALPGVGAYPEWVSHLPIVADLRTLVVTGNALAVPSESGWVIWYDLPTRNEIGRFTASGVGAYLWATASDGKRVYAVSPRKQLFTFDALQPSTVDLVAPQFTLISPPVISGDRIFVGASDGFYAFRKGTEPAAIIAK
jgi:outer membrane protein assembly factor BamB